MLAEEVDTIKPVKYAEDNAEAIKASNGVRLVEVFPFVLYGAGYHGDGILFFASVESLGDHKTITT